MVSQTTDFCFCTLALRNRYRLLTKDLANDLKKYASGTILVVGTDRPQDFKDCVNVWAFKQSQTGILHCFNDKRFVLEKALLKYRTAIYVDADTRIVADISNALNWQPGITGYYKNLEQHVSQYRPQDLENIKSVATKLNISLEAVNWIGEALFSITRDEEKEKEFLKWWSLMARYLELKGMHSGEGSIMGLAAAKVGWKVEKTESLEKLNQIRQHLDVSMQRGKLPFWRNFQRRLMYHYRLNKARLVALKDFDFYYR